MAMYWLCSRSEAMDLSRGAARNQNEESIASSLSEMAMIGHCHQHGWRGHLWIAAHTYPWVEQRKGKPDITVGTQ